jgi:hypothetical protein
MEAGKMKTEIKKSRVLGIAFLIQCVIPILCGVFLQKALIVDGNPGESMINIAGNPMMMRLDIVGELISAMGIIFLGAVLFIVLRKQGEKMALTAFGFYILEAVLLAASRMEAFSLLHISQAYTTGGQPADLLALGSLAQESLRYEYNMAMLAFCVGGPMFYYLLDKARIVPRVMSLWGLITAIPMLVGTLMILFGMSAPIFLYAAYIPFEFVIGAWIVIRGIKEPSDEKLNSAIRYQPLVGSIGG